MLSDEFDFVGVDIARNCLDHPGIPLIVQPLWERIDGTFDAVICTDVLEHIPPRYVQKVIDNIGRLAPHGYLIIALQPERIKFEQPLHLTLESAEWWDEHIPFADVALALNGAAVARY